MRIRYIFEYDKDHIHFSTLLIFQNSNSIDILSCLASEDLVQDASFAGHIQFVHCYNSSKSIRHTHSLAYISSQRGAFTLTSQV